MIQCNCICLFLCQKQACIVKLSKAENIIDVVDCPQTMGTEGNYNSQNDCILELQGNSKNEYIVTYTKQFQSNCRWRGVDGECRAVAMQVVAVMPGYKDCCNIACNLLFHIFFHLENCILISVDTFTKGFLCGSRALPHRYDLPLIKVNVDIAIGK